MKRLAFLLFLAVSAVWGQPHFTFRSNTGVSALFGVSATLTSSIYGLPLAPGDEIGVFCDGRTAADSLCVGAAVWNGSALVITAWGDDEMTPALDGFLTGSRIRFHVWQPAAAREAANLTALFSQGGALFAVNGLYLLESLEKHFHFTFSGNTGQNATIALPASAAVWAGGDHLELGDELAVFADGIAEEDSFCVGAGIWQGDNLTFAIWGDDSMTPMLDGMAAGSRMHLHLWKDLEGIEIRELQTAWSLGDGIFYPDGLYIISRLGATAVALRRPVVPPAGKPYSRPNPFLDRLNLHFELAGPAEVRMIIFDLLGRQVMNWGPARLPAGSQVITWLPARNLPSGIYCYQLWRGGDVSGGQLLHMR